MEIQKDRGKKEEKEGGKERKRQRKQGENKGTNKNKSESRSLHPTFFPFFLWTFNLQSVWLCNLIVAWNFLGQNTGVDNFSLFQGIFPTQGSNPGLPHYRQFLYQDEPPGKPKNTGVGRLSLLQRIFLAQESNQALLTCRQILYQLSNQGSPKWKEIYCNLEIIGFARSSFWFVHKRLWKNRNKLFG